MMRALVLSFLLFLGACASAPTAGPAASRDSLDAVARDYVALILEIGEREPGYVDAYYGPPEWAQAAQANPRDIPALMQGAASLTERLNAISVAGAEPAVAQRKAYLLAHVSAASARLRMLSGERLSFADEAEALFGVRPELRPLSDFDPILAQIDQLVPGDGELAARVAVFRGNFRIPADRLQVVFDASIAECRRRTLAHMNLPANERFTLAFVTDKPWSGYNYYLGGAASRIEINTDQPIFTDRAIDLGCHEAYPGHHVYNALLEQTFVVERGWVEMSVYPLYSPMSFVAEGSANYGIDLAFPGDEAARFEQDVLLPLAGLTGAPVERKAELNALVRRLARAEYTIADDYLAGRIDRAEATQLLSRYMLTTPERAAQRVRFIDTYRSYIINYGLGRDVVQAWVERQGPDHWQGMETLLASQILPVDLF
jgi:hypothetical protein